LASTFRTRQKIPVQPGWYLSPQKKIPSLLKTGFFRQVRELKIQRKNPGSPLGIFIKNSWFFGKTFKIEK
jgi:hypothetical protein